MVGFGVKTPEMAAGVASVADGVIVATALIDAFVALEQEIPLSDPAFQSRVAEKLAAFRAAI